MVDRRRNTEKRTKQDNSLHRERWWLGAWFEMWPNLLNFSSSSNSKNLTRSSASTLVKKDVTTRQHRRNWLIVPFLLLIVRPALLISALLAFAALAPGAAMAAPGDPLQPYVAERDAIILGFRMSGQLDQLRLRKLEQALLSLSNTSSGAIRARATLELGRAQRLSGDFATAATTLTQAAHLAESERLTDVIFDAWIEVTRAHLYGGPDHRAAAAAFELAVQAASYNPTPKQRFNLIGYRAQLRAARGELEASLVDTLLALDLAPTLEDRFFAEFDAADAVMKLAASCDYRKLHDAQSAEDSDGWGACRRAFGLAERAYEQAEKTAKGLFWVHMADEMRGFQQRLKLREKLLESHTRTERMWHNAKVFDPRRPADVLVTNDFSAGAAALPDFTFLADLAEQVAAADEARAYGPPDARSLYLRSLAADIRTGSSREPDLLSRAAELLAEERASFLDPRRRGTVIEDRIGIISTLALRLLALGREAEAFAAFESARARGLEELTQMLARPEVMQADKRWLANLFILEARESAIQTAIVEEVIASGNLKVSPGRSKDLETIEAEIDVANQNGRATQSRISLVSLDAASLEELRKASAAAGIPVLLYWTTPTAVVAWYVGPHGSRVRSVFLPEDVLAEKVGRILDTSIDDGQAFDEAAARQLYLFLVAPFEDLLDSQQLLIVPQGRLFVLPFESLIDPRTGMPLVERWSVSYAPNAGRALASLRREIAKVRQVTAIVDAEIDDGTQETKEIAATGLQLQIMPSIDVSVVGFAESAAGAKNLHLLMHGEFNSTEPLLSQLMPGRDPIPAAELVNLPVGGLQLAVLSACESARVGQRISNEIFGFTWALLAGGAQTVVLSRWLVQGDSNGHWMRLFYAALKRGNSPAQAAGEAMRGMRRDGFSHPYYWAAMQVSGR